MIGCVVIMVYGAAIFFCHSSTTTAYSKRIGLYDKFVGNEAYHIKNVIISSCERNVLGEGKIMYMPIYFAMFLQPSTPDVNLFQ